MSHLTDLLQAIKRNNFVILDTETTGLNEEAEIVQIAILDHMGNILLDSLVKPTCAIPPGATQIHGITDEMVAMAPAWPNIYFQVQMAIQGKDVIIYNSDFDWRLIRQTTAFHEMTSWFEVDSQQCAMLAYAEFWGDWNDYHQSYQWQRLDSACAQQGLPSNNAHTALGDCQMTLALIREMTAKSQIAEMERDHDDSAL